jgi:hypothetical protein
MPNVRISDLPVIEATRSGSLPHRHRYPVPGIIQGGIVPSYAIILREAMPASELANCVDTIVLGTVVGASFRSWISGVIFGAPGSHAARPQWQT